MICPLRLQVAAWLELGGIVEGEDGVAESGGEVAAAFAALDDDLGYVAERLHHVFRLANMDEAYRRSYDARRMSLTFTDQVAEFHEGRGGSAEDEEGVGVLLNGKADAGLGAGKTLIEH